MKVTFVRYLTIAICIYSIFVAPLSLAQQPSQSAAKKFELTIDSIMRGPKLVGYPPTNAYWSQDSQKVYFRWKQADEPRLKETSLYVVNRDGSGLRRLSEEEARLAPPPNGELSKDRTRTVFAEEGNIFLYDHVKGERRQLIKTSDAESNPHFTPDQTSIYFTRQNNLFVMSLDGASLEQLTDIRQSTAPAGSAAPVANVASGGARQGGSQQRGTDSQEFLKKEERTLLDAVREVAVQREEQEAKRKKLEPRKAFNLANGQNIVNLNLSPNGKFVIATISEPFTGAKGTIVPNSVTESGFTEDIPGLKSTSRNRKKQTYNSGQ